MTTNGKGWTMLAGSPCQGTAEAPPRVTLNWQRKTQGVERIDPDAMIDRYIAARTPQGTRPLHAELRAENEHLRLSLLTMAARERETAAERDALRTMLAEARAIVAGRTVPPTGEEIAAHDGMWRCITARDQWDGMGSRLAAAMRDAIGGEACRWWALDSNHCPCSWPTTGGA